ncbi:MAG: hypothetical protein ABJN95_16305 [Maribacter sp.]|uniref:hypothetical protein n=1 Tax=Maribacter sp. TaxID=1897614 RepID=UPI0032985427
MYKVFRLAGFLLTLTLLALPLQSAAQNDAQEGYVVTSANDTLYGLLRDRKTGAFSKLYKKVKFKGKRGKSRYGPKEIKSYTIGSSTFESLQIIQTGGFLDDEYTESAAGDFQFLKVVAKGSLCYYLMEFEDADSGYIDTIAFFKKEDGHTLVRVNQGLFGLKRKKLALFLSDCPELAQNIINKRIKHPMEIVRFYNNWKHKDL